MSVEASQYLAYRYKDIVAFQQESNKHAGMFPWLRARFIGYFHRRGGRYWLDLVGSVFAVTSFVLYAASTYWLAEMDDFNSLPGVVALELVLSFYFLLAFLARWFAGSEVEVYFSTPHPVLDVLSFAPLFILLRLRVEGQMSFTLTTFLSFLRFVRIFKVLYLQRHYRDVLRGSGTTYQVFRLLALFMSICLTVCALVQISELYCGGGKWTFDQAFYFCMTTLSTVGYGDFSAVTIVGRAVVVCLMITSLVFIPLNTATLISSYELARYTGRFSKSWFAQVFSPILRWFQLEVEHAHVIVLVPSGTSEHYLSNFLTELCRSGHGDSQFLICVVFQDSVNPSVEALLMSRDYAHRLQFLTGTVIDDNDLIRAGIFQAQACFVLPIVSYEGSHYSSSLPENLSSSIEFTSISILRALSIKKLRASIPLFIQVNESMYLIKKHPLWEVLKAYQDSICIVSVDDIKMQLFARSCFIPGLCTFIRNLVASYEYSDYSKSSLDFSASDSSVTFDPLKFENKSIINLFSRLSAPNMFVSTAIARQLSNRNLTSPASKSSPSKDTNSGMYSPSPDHSVNGSEEDYDYNLTAGFHSMRYMSEEMQDEIQRILEARKSKSMLFPPNVTSGGQLPLWYLKYREGADYEIYPAVLPSSLVGMCFSRASALIYEHFRPMDQKYRICLFAMAQLRENTSIHVLLNPGHAYQIKAGDVGFVMATDCHHAASLFNFEVPDEMKSSTCSYALCVNNIIPRSQNRDTNGRSHHMHVYPSSATNDIALEMQGVDSFCDKLDGFRAGKISATSKSDAIHSPAATLNNDNKFSLAAFAASANKTFQVAGSKLHLDVPSTPLTPNPMFSTAEPVPDEVSSPQSQIETPTRIKPSVNFHTPEEDDPSSGPKKRRRDDEDITPNATLSHARPSGRSRVRPRAATDPLHRFTSLTSQCSDHVNFNGGKAATPAAPAAPSLFASVSDTQSTITSQFVHKLPHIVVCGHVSDGLVGFVRHLRSPYVDERFKHFCPLVVLHPNSSSLPAFPGDTPKPVLQSTDTNWINMLAEFTEVYHVVGSPLNPDDLIRAGVPDAKYVVVLGSPSTGSVKGSTTVVDDIEAIAISAAVNKFLNQYDNDTTLLVELRHDTNVRFVHSLNRSGGGADYDLEGNLADGTLFVGSIFDRLLPQSFYNPHVGPVVKALISGSNISYNSSDSEFGWIQMEKKRTNELRRHILAQFRENQEAAQSQHHRSSRSGRLSKPGWFKQSDSVSDVPDAVFTDSCPPEFAGCFHPSNLGALAKLRADPNAELSYGEWFRLLTLELGWLPMGLYRVNPDPNSCIPNYVYTNPPEMCRVSPNDNMYVLCPTSWWQSFEDELAKRRLKVPQCEVCNKSSAQYQCKSCARDRSNADVLEPLKLCAKCDRASHVHPSRQQHQRSHFFSSMCVARVCEHCQQTPASIRCDSCPLGEQALCGNCDAFVHSSRTTKTHSRAKLV